MLIVSWNVNGLKACWGKGLKDFINSRRTDIFCLQESKLQDEFSPLADMGYHTYWSFADRHGYSGTVCLCAKEPLNVTYGIGVPRFDGEGRVITLDYGGFYAVNCYVPNSKGSLERYCFRMDWDIAFREYLRSLQYEKPVIVCGDFNVAFSYADIYPENLLNDENPSGFLDEERDGLQELFDSGFIDTFRYLYPDKTGAYSWWSSRLNKRSENRGWRIDYILMSRAIAGRLTDAGMYADVRGSDHCPIFAEVADNG